MELPVSVVIKGFHKKPILKEQLTAAMPHK